MLCPHCQKDIGLDPLTPEALLVHLNKQVQVTKKDLEDRQRIYPDDPYPRKTRNLAKWIAWRDWVQERI